MSQYSRWFPLSEEGLAASGLAGPAAIQVRREQGLVDYGTGKSAMVWYGYASTDGEDTLREVFARELHTPGVRGQGPLLFRFFLGESARDSMVKRAHQFSTRFEGPPLFNR